MTIYSLPTIWVIGFVVLILLVAILLLVSQLIRRRRVNQRALESFNKDEATAFRRANVEAQHLAAMEAQQRQTRQFSATTPAPMPIVLPGMNAINEQKQSPVAQTSQQTPPMHDLPCPRCGNMVRAGAKHCSSCSIQLARTPSGKLVALPEPERMPANNRVSNPTKSTNTTMQALLHDLWDKAGER